MKKIHLGHVFVGLCLLMLGLDIGLALRHALASRNSAGTMSTLNTFVSGTTISSTNVNANFADIATEITDSLDRSGKGPMLAPLRLTNGTFAAPSLNFDSDTDTGIYRIGANNLGVTANGAKVLDVATTGLGVTGTLAVSSTTALSDALSISKSGTAAVSLATIYEPSLTTGNAANIILGAANTSNNALLLEYTGNATAANSTACLYIAGASGSTLCVNGNAKVTAGGAGGLQIGSSGTAIKQRMVGTTTWNPGTVSACGAGPCLTVTTTISMSGVATGNPCYAGVYDPAPLSGWPVQCITTANTCSLMIVNQSNVNKAFGSATFYCVVDVL